MGKYLSIFRTIKTKNMFKNRLNKEQKKLLYALKAQGSFQMEKER
jgi:hypothetical protein